MEKAPAVLDEEPAESQSESRPNRNGKRLFEDDQCEIAAKRPTKSAQSDEKFSADVATNKKQLVEEMKLILQKMQTRWTEMEEVLRKLNMVKMYRTKNNLDKLEALIESWRQAGQEAVKALAKSCEYCEQKSTSCKTILDQMQIDYSLIKYDPEEDCFY